MKTFFISLVSLLTFLTACSAIKDLTDGENMEIANAGFENWREAPEDGSDVPEVGSNLAVAVRFWPEEEEGYEVKYIIFNERKSMPAKITMREGRLTIINATVIRSSSVMAKKSEEINLSDRLVFTRPDGEIGFLRIEEWTQLGL